MIFQSTAISTVVSDFCSSYRIEWRFIPERSPHFGRLWEAAVKSTKTHLRRCETILWRTHYCISSSWSLPEQPPFSACKYSWWWRHWGPDAWIFLDRQTPFCALPDPSFSYHSISLLRRWHLCQNLVHHRNGLQNISHYSIDTTSGITPLGTWMWLFWRKMGPYLPSGLLPEWHVCIQERTNLCEMQM